MTGTARQRQRIEQALNSLAIRAIYVFLRLSQELAARAAAPSSLLSFPPISAPLHTLSATTFSCTATGKTWVAVAACNTSSAAVASSGDGRCRRHVPLPHRKLQRLCHRTVVASQSRPSGGVSPPLAKLSRHRIARVATPHDRIREGGVPPPSPPPLNTPTSALSCAPYEKGVVAVVRRCPAGVTCTAAPSAVV